MQPGGYSVLNPGLHVLQTMPPAVSFHAAAMPGGHTSTLSIPAEGLQSFYAPSMSSRLPIRPVPIQASLATPARGATQALTHPPSSTHMEHVHLRPPAPSSLYMTSPSFQFFQPHFQTLLPEQAFVPDARLAALNLPQGAMVRGWF
jgi:hypothetical protein